MVLSDDTLRAMMESRESVVEPIEPYQVQPASVDLRFGGTDGACRTSGACSARAPESAILIG